MPTPAHTASRASTPRPSISPLSTASRVNRSSPIVLRDATMLGADRLRGRTLDDADTRLADDTDSRSSSLSDPDDDEEGDDDGLGGAANSEAVSHTVLDVDSEAETERLDQTPYKLRRHADSIGKTPSKLNQAAALDDDLSDPPSPLPAAEVGGASSTSTIATVGKKRKRSDPVESPLTSAESDVGESPRKRSHDRTIAPGVQQDAEENGDVVDDLAVTSDLKETPTPLLTKGARGGRKGGKLAKERKAKEPTDEATEADITPPEIAADLDVELAEGAVASTEQVAEPLEAEASGWWEKTANVFMSLRQKIKEDELAAATAELEMLEKPNCRHPDYLRQVACVNARLDKQTREAHAYYNYRLQSIRERTIGERSSIHSQYFQHVRELREDVLDELGKEWYNIQQERRQSNQEKDEAYIFKFPEKKSAQIRQQAKYNQEVSVLSGVAKYVGFPAAPDILGTRPEDIDDDLKAMRIPKHVAQTTHNPQPVASGMHRVGSQSMAQAQSERIAHEQFVEQNAWARTQPPMHRDGGWGRRKGGSGEDAGRVVRPAQSAPLNGGWDAYGGTPGGGGGLTHTPDWAAEPQSSATNLIRNLSGQAHQTRSPYSTPMPQKRAPPPELSSSGTVAVNSDGAEPPSSVIAVPPTTDRLAHLFPRDQGSSPLQVLKQRHQSHQNGGGGQELTGFPNTSSISGVSGASTIDAPQEQDREPHHHHHHHYHQPGLLQEPVRPTSKDLPGFETSGLHGGNHEERRDMYSGALFRRQEGSYGTPAPLPGPT